jgi:hypothetical protein
MAHKDNPRARIQDQPAAPFSRKSTKADPKNGGRGIDNVPADGGPNAPAVTGEGSVDVVFDLAQPDQARNLEGFKSAFGDDHAEVESLGHGEVVLRLYPGGTRRLP